MIKRVFVAEERAALGAEPRLDDVGEGVLVSLRPVLRSVQTTSYHAGMRIVLLDVGILCVKMDVNSRRKVRNEEITHELNRFLETFALMMKRRRLQFDEKRMQKDN